MASVNPFKGILYNTEKMGNLSNVVMPPFDVISEEEREHAYERHPQNVIRLILNKATESDTPENNTHTRAAGCFRQWLEDGILVQDTQPAIYLTALEFSNGHRTMTRYGLIAAVGLEPFEKGVIIPHERTFSKVKSERLDLMKACKANFSPIFAMYSDPGNHIRDLVTPGRENRVPDVAFTDTEGQHHSMWRITDPVIVSKIQDAMADKKIFIADGHHRYETALNYRRWVEENTGKLSSGHPANFVMMYLTCMEDPGLVIMPAHRMLKGICKTKRDAFLQKAAPLFDIIKIPFSDTPRSDAQKEFLRILESEPKQRVIGLFMKEDQQFYLLKMKTGAMADLPEEEVQDALKALDVTVLTRLVFMEILGFDQTTLDNEAIIGYSKDVGSAIDAVADGPFDMAFILNPTTIDQVRRIAESGAVMPRKATYFYPKVSAGLVLNDLRPAGRSV